METLEDVEQGIAEAEFLLKTNPQAAVQLIRRVIASRCFKPNYKAYHCAAEAYMLIGNKRAADMFIELGKMRCRETLEKEARERATGTSKESEQQKRIRLSNEKEAMIASLKRGSEALQIGHFKTAIDCYRNAAPKLLPKGDKPERARIYALSLAYIGQGTYESLVTAVELLGKLKGRTFPAAYYALAKALERLNRFKQACDAAEEGLALLGRLSLDTEPYCWPGQSELVPHTDQSFLETELKSLIDKCSLPPKPTAMCRFSKCVELSSHIIPSELIYDSDIDFNGYVYINCEENCNIAYHPTCWKHFKEGMSDVVKITDKDILGIPCPTNGCSTGAQTPRHSIIIHVTVVGANSGIKSQISRERSEETVAALVAPVIGQPKKQRKQKAEKAAGDAVAKTRAGATKQVNSKVGHAKRNSETETDVPRAAGEISRALSELCELRQHNFGRPNERTFDPRDPFFGHGRELPQEADSDSNVAAQKLKFFKHFTTLLKKNNTITKSQAVQLGQEKCINVDYPFLRHNSVVPNELIKSYKFSSIDDNICLSENINKLYKETRTSLESTLMSILNHTPKPRVTKGGACAPCPNAVKKIYPPVDDSVVKTKLQSGNSCKDIKKTCETPVTVPNSAIPKTEISAEVCKLVARDNPLSSADSATVAGANTSQLINEVDSKQQKSITEEAKRTNLIETMNKEGVAQGGKSPAVEHWEELAGEEAEVDSAAEQACNAQLTNPQQWYGCLTGPEVVETTIYMPEKNLHDSILVSSQEFEDVDTAADSLLEEKMDPVVTRPFLPHLLMDAKPFVPRQAVKIQESSKSISWNDAEIVNVKPFVPKYLAVIDEEKTKKVSWADPHAMDKKEKDQEIAALQKKLKIAEAHKIDAEKKVEGAQVREIALHAQIQNIKQELEQQKKRNHMLVKEVEDVSSRSVSKMQGMLNAIGEGQLSLVQTIVTVTEKLAEVNVTNDELRATVANLRLENTILKNSNAYEKSSTNVDNLVILHNRLLELVTKHWSCIMSGFNTTVVKLTAQMYSVQPFLSEDTDPTEAEVETCIESYENMLSTVSNMDKQFMENVDSLNTECKVSKTINEKILSLTIPKLPELPENPLEQLIDKALNDGSILKRISDKAHPGLSDTNVRRASVESIPLSVVSGAVSHANGTLSPCPSSAGKLQLQQEAINSLQSLSIQSQPNHQGRSISQFQLHKQAYNPLHGVNSQLQTQQHSQNVTQNSSTQCQPQQAYNTLQHLNTQFQPQKEAYNTRQQSNAQSQQEDNTSQQSSTQFQPQQRAYNTVQQSSTQFQPQQQWYNTPQQSSTQFQPQQRAYNPLQWSSTQFQPQQQAYNTLQQSSTRFQPQQQAYNTLKQSSTQFQPQQRAYNTPQHLNAQFKQQPHNGHQWSNSHLVPQQQAYNMTHSLSAELASPQQEQMPQCSSEQLLLPPQTTQLHRSQEQLVTAVPQQSPTDQAANVQSETLAPTPDPTLSPSLQSQVLPHSTPIRNPGQVREMQVDRKFRRFAPTVTTSDPNCGSGALRITRFGNLAFDIKAGFPLLDAVPDEDVHAALAVVRNKNNNSMKGLAYDEIVMQARQLLLQGQTETSEATNTEHEICCICMEAAVKDTVTLECKHNFHTICIDKWTSSEHAFCPVCRHPIDHNINIANSDDFPPLAQLRAKH